MSQEDEVDFRVEEAGERLDLWLSSRLPHLSRTRIQKLIDSKLVLVNGVSSHSRYRVRLGDQIYASLLVDEPLQLNPQKINLEILFEDEDILLINKEAGVTVHPGAGTFGQTTLVEGVLFYLNRQDHTGNLRPGIVHRLDRDTTGVLVISKNEYSHQKLSLQFSEKSNRREYAALLNGVLREPTVTVESFLSRDPHNRLKFISQAEDPGRGARWAKTIFTSEAMFAHRLTLASIRLHTGRTHQIRVHSRALNASILGDQLYGQPVDFGGHMSKEVQAQLNKAPRQMLHARLLGFLHPRTQQEVLFEAPIPEDFKQILYLVKPYAVSVD